MARDEARWQSGEEHDGTKGSGVTGRQIGVGVVVLGLLVFVLQNTSSTQVTLFLFDVTFPLWMVLGGTILISIGVGYAVGARRRRGKD